MFDGCFDWLDFVVWVDCRAMSGCLYCAYYVYSCLVILITVWGWAVC